VKETNNGKEEIKIMKKRRTTSAPTSVKLLLTRECNLNCFYCGADQFKKNENEPELTTNEWIDVLRRLKEIRVFTIDFSGGEIFLRDDVFEILETAVECRFPKITITTNGTLIDPAAAGKLESLNLKDIAVSLDGEKGSNDQIRGEGAFTGTVEGIGNLIGRGIDPNILFTPLKSNYKRLADMVDVLYPLGVRRISFNILHPTGRCRKIYKDVMLDFFVDIGDFKKIIKIIREKYIDLKIDDHLMGYNSFPAMYREYKSSSNLKNTKKLKPCSAGHSTCNITSAGWVIPCSEFFDFKGGNIREQDILDIWMNSQNFERIRRLSDISIDQIPYCKNCDYNIFCNSGCRADAYAVYGDLLAPDPFCPYWKEK
jgi:radical SAM protein with 4Fe4S-binding SPASM domain